MPDDDDDDFLDGMCDLDFDNGPEVTDEQAPYVALFASLLTTELEVRNWAELERRAHEWHVLFDEPVL